MRQRLLRLDQIYGGRFFYFSKTLRQIGISAPHWQKGFFDHLMREDSYENKWRYISENPVRKSLVMNSQEWVYQGEVEFLEFN